MRIDFDAGNAAELTAVAALIASLRGTDDSVHITGSSEIILPPIVAPPAPAAPIADAPLAPVAAAPPAAPAGIIAPPAPSPAPAGVDIDADGLPWDGRIHSTPASKKKDGKWRGRRNLDAATRDAVTAELRAALAAPAAEPGQPAPMFEEAAPGVPLPPEPVVDAATAFGAGGAAPASSPPAPPPPAVAPPPPAPAAPAGPATDFASLMKKITGLQQGGHLTVTDTTNIAVSLGLAGVRDLMVRPDLIASFDALLPVPA